MSVQGYDEFERDEELLEARRLKRLEMKRKRKMQQRIILGVLAVVLILAIVLIAKGCSAKKEPEPEQQETVQPPVQEEKPPVEPDTTATLAAVGDIMVYDEQIADAKKEDSTYDFSEAFSAISAYTTSPDLMVGNLELNFLGSNYGGKPAWSAPESLATNLKNIGFDILQTANTYSINNGVNGLTNTIKFLNSAGIEHVGTYIDSSEKADGGGVLIREVNGIKFAFLAFTKGVNGFTLPSGSEYCVDLLYKDYNSNYSNVNEDAITARLDAAKQHNPDVIVAMLHWGSEYKTEVSESMKEIQDLLLKGGVDVILGSHSHVVGPMEMVRVKTNDGETKECFVAASLGNFFSYMSNDYTMESVILNLEFTKSGETGETTISKAEYTPLYILDRGAEADVRFEVLPIRAALDTSIFEDYRDKMLEAIDHIKTNSNSTFDSGK